MPWKHLGFPAALHGAALDLVLPPVCAKCQAVETSGDHNFLCHDCTTSIVQPLPWLCGGCGRYANPYSQPRRRCPACRQSRHRFDQVVTLGPYEGELRGVIVRMKQVMEQSLTFAVGRILGERAQSCCDDDMPEIILPVPIHWLRRLARQVSSAEILASGVAASLGGHVETRMVACARWTNKQSLLTVNQRRENVRLAYRIHARRADRLQGRHVAVVDDTLTTGATLDEIARLLKQHRARKVTAFVAACAKRVVLPVTH